jgi:hypothetical protein
MKTTVDIPDALLRRLRERAARQGTTLKALLQVAIREFLGQGGGRGSEFRLRDGSFRGEGTAPGVREGDWRAISEMSYEGRGGAGTGSG